MKCLHTWRIFLNSNNVRAVALYRASTKNQTDRENSNDIPAQRKIVQEFIFNKGWNLTREFTEEGVSGFKTSEKDRDALQTIKTMAVNNEFDILVIYMSDRLGRIADETPLVVTFLNKNDVKVWSVSEGEINAESHADKLLTYIRYWQNEGESIKTSERVSDYLIEAVKDGRFKGGNCIPLGYMLVDNGNKNFKGRAIKDFVINPDEVELVKLIYYLSSKMNYGQRRIAIYLNEHGFRTGGGKAWKSAPIQLILSNPIYKGQFRIYSKMYDKEVFSPIQENLVIIPEHEWDENRKIIESRTNKKKSKNYEYTRNTHGKLLLSGIAFCGHCGQKLTTFLETKRYKKKNGEVTTRYAYRYRCMSFYKRGAVECDGQSAYGAKKINTAVVEEVKQFMFDLQEKNLNEEFIKNLKKQNKDAEKEKSQKQKELEQLYKELKVLKDEVVKSLMGNSQFSPDMLKDLISEKDALINKENEYLSQLETKVQKMNSDVSSYKTLDKNIYNWNKRFDEADEEMKKSMLISVIDKVRVFKDEIEITFNVRMETYKENSTMYKVPGSTTS